MADQEYWVKLSVEDFRGTLAELQRLRSIEAAARALSESADVRYVGDDEPNIERLVTVDGAALDALEAALGQGQAGERGGSGGDKA